MLSGEHCSPINLRNQARWLAQTMSEDNVLGQKTDPFGEYRLHEFVYYKQFRYKHVHIDLRGYSVHLKPTHLAAFSNKTVLIFWTAMCTKVSRGILRPDGYFRRQLHNFILFRAVVHDIQTN